MDTECICVANESLSKITFLANVKLNAIGAGCIIEVLDIGSDINDLDATQANIVTNIMLGHMDGDAAVEEIEPDFANAPIRPAEGWGLMRRRRLKNLFYCKMEVWSGDQCYF